MGVSWQELREEFRQRLREARCPECELAYTEWSVGWCEGWIAGRIEALRECGVSERDGEFHIMCELCHRTSAMNPFSFSPRLLPK